MTQNASSPARAAGAAGLGRKLSFSGGSNPPNTNPPTRFQALRYVVHFPTFSRLRITTCNGARRIPHSNMLGERGAVLDGAAS
jgi:hypothetical protein